MDKSTYAKFVKFGGDVLAVHVASMSFLPEWQVVPDIRAALTENPPSYEEAQRWEMQRMIKELGKKTYDDYIREAEYRFQLLNGIQFSDPITNPPVVENLRTP
jgi:hypothetical protein